MSALKIEARAIVDEREGVHWLLVFESCSVGSIEIAQEVKAVVQLNPSLKSISILAPNADHILVRDQICESAAIHRLSAVGANEYVFGLIYFEPNYENSPLNLYRFKVTSDGTVGATSCLLESNLVRSWLTGIFRAHGGIVSAPDGVHFGKTSSRHAQYFLRTANVLQNSLICSTIAFFLLPFLRRLRPQRILIDTSPLLPLALTLSSLAIRHKVWSVSPRVESFSSYQGLDSQEFYEKSDLVLISASTSNRLVSKIKSKHGDKCDVLTLFFLASNDAPGRVDGCFCDLEFDRVSNLEGLAPIENYDGSKGCRWCQSGYFLAEFEGDQFLLGKRKFESLLVRQISQDAVDRAFFDEICGTNTLGLSPYMEAANVFDLTFDAHSLVKNCKQFVADFLRISRRLIPVKTDYYLIADPEGVRSPFVELLVEAQLVEKDKFVDVNELDRLDPITQGGVLVLVPFLVDYHLLREINQSLRSIVPDGIVSYLVGIAVGDRLQDYQDLKSFLTYGKQGADTFELLATRELFLSRPTNKSAWIAERELIRSFEPELRCEIESEISSRVRAFEAGRLNRNSLFWSHGTSLKIGADFVFLDSSLIGTCSQVDIYAVVSNLLASARNRNQSLRSRKREQTGSNRFVESIYGAVLLDPQNFEDFNDPVLHAAFLRAALDSELKYYIDVRLSGRMYLIIQLQFRRFEKGIESSFLEFLISMASSRLRLSVADAARISSFVRNSTVSTDVMKRFMKVVESLE